MITDTQKRRLFRDLEKPDHEFMEKAEPFFEGLYRRYFRCDMTGWENLPEGKVLFVGNHNGLLTWEILMLFYAWWKRFGFRRRVVGVAHGIAVSHPAFKWLTRRVGAIPADPDLARETLERGYSLMVYPGGEKESFRPYSERKRVDFFQRKGFIRLALRAKVPIVPVVSVGAHETYVILDRGEKLAEALGLKKRYRLHGVPITLRSVFFLWCISAGLLTFFPLLLAPAAFASIFVPLPAKMTFRILPPIDVCAMVDPELSDSENLQRIYDRVVATIQEVVTEEYARRKYPVIG